MSDQAAAASGSEESPIAAAGAAMERLLESYAKAVTDADEQDLSLALFKTQWKAADVSKLHYQCPAGSDRADYMQCLFAAALGAPPLRPLPLTQRPTAETQLVSPRLAVYISDAYEIYKRVGCAFLLYCLHGTQPRQPKLPIRLVQSLWEPMVQLRQDVRRRSSDGFAVLTRMHEQGILEYCNVATTGLGASIADAAAMQASRQYSDIRAIRRRPLELASKDYVDVDQLAACMVAYRDAKAVATAHAQNTRGARGSGGLGAARLLSRLSYVDMQWDKKMAKIMEEHETKLATGMPSPPATSAAAGHGAEASSRIRKRSPEPAAAGGTSSSAPAPRRARPTPQSVDASAAETPEDDEEFADMSSLIGGGNM